MDSGIKLEWSEVAKPQLNTWYKCKVRDDWYKILKEGKDNFGVIVYKIVSFRKGCNVFFGITLKQARAVIKIETYCRTTYGK